MKTMRALSLGLMICCAALIIMGITQIIDYSNTEPGEITQCYDKHNNPIIGAECEETNNDLLVVGALLIFMGLFITIMIPRLWWMDELDY